MQTVCIGRSELCFEIEERWDRITAWALHRRSHVCVASVLTFFSLLQLLCEEWASYGVFYKYQPIDLVRWELSPKVGFPRRSPSHPCSAARAGPSVPVLLRMDDCELAVLCPGIVPHLHLQLAWWKQGEQGWEGRKLLQGFSILIEFFLLWVRAKTLWSN